MATLSYRPLDAGRWSVWIATALILAVLPLIFSGAGKVSLDHLIAMRTHQRQRRPLYGPSTWAVATAVFAIPFLMLIPIFGIVLLIVALALALAARRLPKTA